MVEQLVANQLTGVRFSLPATARYRKLGAGITGKAFPASTFQLSTSRVVDNPVSMCIKDIVMVHVKALCTGSVEPYS